MKVIVRNSNRSISLPLTALRFVGFWAPDKLSNRKKIFYNCYALLSFMFLLGIYLITQVVELYLIWGDLPMMTGVAFVFFTNVAQSMKIFNILKRRQLIQDIINECDEVLESAKGGFGRDIVRSCDRETFFLLCVYMFLTNITLVGWATSAEKNKLPLQAWYPYETSKSPAYELTFAHQVVALTLAAFINIGKDTLVVSLIAQCRCRMRLLGLLLRNLYSDPSGKHLSPTIPERLMKFTLREEKILRERLKQCVIEHQKVLRTSLQIQNCFSEPTFLQLTVSLIIICVTAFQLIAQTGNLVRFLSMLTYLLNMMFQVFIYCYQGTQLTEESTEIAEAAYESPWYCCGVETRRTILILMTRCRRFTKITAMGFTTLSLASFMAIIKLSYSLFTLLQQVEDKQSN